MTLSERSKRHLVIFARLPVPGETKTRLIPVLGAEAAADVYLYLAQSTLRTVRELVAHNKVTATVFFTGGDRDAMARVFGSECAYRPQLGQDLGERLIAAARVCFNAGAEQLVFIGTDCLELTEGHLSQAFGNLESHDSVLGPATDGGYYLLGMHGDRTALFEGIDWSTDRVAAQTIAIARRRGWSMKRLPPLSDIDYAEDLVSVRAQMPLMQTSSMPMPSVLERWWPVHDDRWTIIIPARNEAKNLPDTLRSIGPADNATEIILVDGGSSDDTVCVGESFGCRTIRSTIGRARQMNVGAVVATGTRLLFLHADTRVPAGYRQEMDRVLGTQCIAGAFRLRISGQLRGLKSIAWGANTRSRFLGMPYGDQGIFLRAADFYRLGGFRNELPLMEDYEFMRRARRKGSIGLTQSSVRTSGRSWERRGVVMGTLINQLCIAMYHAGFSPDRIARVYRGRVNH